ncbi:MAG: hypothetical protein ACR2J0_03425, partial [Mycobacteriales bacterium]
ALGGLGVLCQLGSEGPFRAEMERWVPGFAEIPPRRTPRRRVSPPARLPTPEQPAVVEPPPDDTVLTPWPRPRKPR